MKRQSGPLAIALGGPRPLVVSAQFDRHLLPILTVGPVAQKHGAHAAVTELADDLITAEALSQQGLRLERFG